MNEKSRSLFDQFAAKMEEIEGKIEKGLSLQPVFEDLRKLQKEINDSDLLRDHRKKIWNRIDVSFKKVKELRFGEASEAERNQIARLESRLQGLDGVIKRMQHTVKLDVRELDRLAKNSDSPFGMLEEQLKSAKRMMVEERLASKQSKLDDMLSTQKELKEKLAKLREKDESKRLIDEAKKMAELKIAEEIKSNADQRKEDEDKLVKAAEELKESRGPKKAKKEEKPSDLIPDDSAINPEEALSAAEESKGADLQVPVSEEE
jgi:Zn-dependent oligopeptidase